MSTVKALNHPECRNSGEARPASPDGVGDTVLCLDWRLIIVPVDQAVGHNVVLVKG